MTKVKTLKKIEENCTERRKFLWGCGIVFKIGSNVVDVLLISLINMHCYSTGSLKSEEDDEGAEFYDAADTADSLNPAYTIETHLMSQVNNEPSSLDAPPPPQLLTSAVRDSLCIFSVKGSCRFHSKLFVCCTDCEWRDDFKIISLSFIKVTSNQNKSFITFMITDFNYPCVVKSLLSW